MITELNLQDAFVSIASDKIVLGNRFFRREIDISGGYPRTTALVSGDTRWADESKKSCDCSFFGMNMPGRGHTEYAISGNARAVIADTPQFDAPHIELVIPFEEKVQKLEFERIFHIYPEIPACSVRNTLTSQVIPGCYWSHRTELSASSERFPSSFQESCADSFRLAPGVRAIRSVEFRGRTDYHNEPVIEHNIDTGEGFFTGNLLFMQGNAADKLIILQEAPPSSERRDFEKYDFRLAGGELFSCCWGIAPEDLHIDRKVTGYRHTMIFAASGGEPESVLKKYLSKRFPMQSHEAAILVNPWGCGNFPKLFSAGFLRGEICAAEDIGAEVYQIDDAWQNGNGLAELTENNRAINRDFWKVSPKHFPEGMETITRSAGRIKLGLWCAPSFTGAYQDWEEFADMLIEYHRKYGFATVKIDGVRLQSAASEACLEAMLRKVRQETGGQVYFNLDTTNGQRSGYFLFLEYGSIFLENRYVTYDGVISYHPEKTLRNLWHLSRYVRTQSLQIEIPSPDDIPANADFCVKPQEYGFEYWCAVAIFANMLIWTAPSRLSENNRGILRKMIRLHKNIRQELFGSTIRPVLNVPDGRSLTGFASDSGLYLIFRELHCPVDTVEMPSPDGTVIAGDAALDGCKLTLPAGSYCIWKQN